MATATSQAPSNIITRANQQFDFLGLPRELRDEIYEYYTYDEEGLAYDYPSKTLKYANGRELGLAYTCKTVANEMKGFHLRTNSITFTPSCTGADKVAFCGQRSTAARFEHLLHEARWTKMFMLHYATECVKDVIIKMALQKYPAVSSVFRPCFRTISRALDFGHRPRSYQLYQAIFTASFCDAVQYTLDLISYHPKFQDLISQACGSPRHYFGDRSPFVEGSHRQVLA
jgi:hypothetical protein